MRKGIRIAFFALLILAGAGIITWFLIMRRQVPAHAQCIPKNAIAVLTLNLRELALDHAAGGHLFPEMADEKMPKELERFTKALDKNDGSGLKKTADVLGFIYQDGEAAFFGISAALNDSATFGKLLRNELTKELSLHPFSSAGKTTLRLDTSAAVIGWNNDIALFLYPVGNHTAAETAEQCAKLLSLTTEQSVLADENFREHELSSFDAGLWIQPKSLLVFTGGSALLRTYFNNVKYLSLAMDFQDGEMIARKIITNEKVLASVPYNAPVLISCDPKQVLAFYRGALNLQNDSLLADYVNCPPLNTLPFDDARSEKLCKYLDGNYTLLFHDTFSYDMDYITYDYDADFNRIPRHEMKRENGRGYTMSIGLKDKNAAQQLVAQWMQEDSIPLTGSTWTISKSGATEYLMLNDNMLTLSNWKQTDGKKRELPMAWANLDAALPLGKIILPQLVSALSFFITSMDDEEQLLAAHLDELLVSEVLVAGNVQSCQVRLTMKNKNVNALVQLEDLVRKILK